MAQESSATTIFASFQQYLDAEQDKREVSWVLFDRGSKIFQQINGHLNYRSWHALKKIDLGSLV